MLRNGQILAAVVTVVLACGTSNVANAQRTGTGTGTGSTGSTGTGAANPSRTANFPGGNSQPFGVMDSSTDNRDPNTVLLEHRREMALQNDRQKRIADDTARLLKLAQDLKEQVDKTSKDTLSLEVIKKAEEIEKLAHDVKQRMKG